MLATYFDSNELKLSLKEYQIPQNNLHMTGKQVIGLQLEKQWSVYEELYN